MKRRGVNPMTTDAKPSLWSRYWPGFVGLIALVGLFAAPIVYGMMNGA